jgi:hypothetical protein
MGGASARDDRRRGDGVAARSHNEPEGVIVAQGGSIGAH